MIEILVIILCMTIWFVYQREAFRCSKYLYPDMYSPLSSCSDPFNWGFTYSTGRCPHKF